MAAVGGGGGMVWSATLASRLPGSPTKEGPGIVNEQPRSPVTNVPNEIEQKEDNSLPSCIKDMKNNFFEHRILME